MDDDRTTAGGLNAATSFEDVAYGGAGRDVLIANTGGDRLIGWVDEFDSPFSPFGAGTVSRHLAPDAGTDPLRNGEPNGEPGMGIQSDFAWQEQDQRTPADPQPGNGREVLRTAAHGAHIQNRRSICF